MEKIKNFWNGLTKRGKILVAALAVIAALIVINYF
tara:strand:- start:3198 stop:3302 length:105 start_codon:yes stop_codon:yes gene_type:complete